MRLSLTVFGLLAAPLLAAPTAAHATRMGWVVPPQFHETQEPPTSNPRSFYLKGEGPSHWTERVQIIQATLPTGASADDWLNGLDQRARTNCPDLFTHAFPKQSLGDFEIASEMVQCHEDTVSHRSRVTVRKALADGHDVFTITAQGEYPPVPKGKTGLSREQVARWMDFVSSFTPCGDASDPACLRDPGELVAAKPATITPQQAEAIEQIETLGEEMYRQDQIAWHSTDALANRNIQMPAGHGAYIAIPGPGISGKLYLVADGTPNAVVKYVVITDAKGEHAISDGEPSDLTADVESRFQALQTALNQPIQACSKHINPLVIPGADGNGWWVYLLSASSDAPRIWIGGGTRFHISRDGKHVLEKQASAKSCLALDGSNHEIAYYVVTQLVTDMPSEFHAFQSLTWHKPMFVAARSGIWKVDGDKVTKLDLPDGIH